MAKGFNRPPMGQNNMMNQFKRMQEQFDQIQQQLGEETVTATVGGGAVKVTMTGDQKCKGVEISADFLKDADAEMLQDMVLTAVNMALDQSRALQSERMGPLSGGLGGLGLF